MLWMFGLDHTRYSRWLSVHIRDMMNLTDKHPDVLAESKSGKFVVHKTRNEVSTMSVDQCHEQNNAVVKGSGEFEKQAIRGHGLCSRIGHLHHDQKPGVQAAFMKDVRTLIAVFQEMGNPFLENTQDLLVLDTYDTAVPRRLFS